MVTKGQLLQLIAGLRDVVVGQQVSADGAAAGQQKAATDTDSFAQCCSRFSGESGEDIEAFINAISIYKGCVNVSDANALRGLPMLLDKIATTWWQGIKSSVKTCDEELLAMRHAFGIRKPAHKIFRELFTKEQADNEPTDVFVTNA